MYPYIYLYELQLPNISKYNDAILNKIIKLMCLFMVFFYFDISKTTSSTLDTKLEDIFVQEFGNVSPLMWTKAEEMSSAELQNICENAHIQAGEGSVNVLQATLERGILKLYNNKHRNMDVQILQCVPEYTSIDIGMEDDGIVNSEFDIFYLTHGINDDTVFYLKHLKKDKGIHGEKVFSLYRLIGGLLISPKAISKFENKNISHLSGQSI